MDTVIREKLVKVLDGRQSHQVATPMLVIYASMSSVDMSHIYPQEIRKAAQTSGGNDCFDSR